MQQKEPLLGREPITFMLGMLFLITTIGIKTIFRRNNGKVSNRS